MPDPQVVRLGHFGFADLALELGVLALLAVIAHGGSEAMVGFRPPNVTPTVLRDPRQLPDDAARSSLRMLLALAASLLFSLVYGWIAALERRAERWPTTQPRPA